MMLRVDLEAICSSRHGAACGQKVACKCRKDSKENRSTLQTQAAQRTTNGGAARTSRQMRTECAQRLGRSLHRSLLKADPLFLAPPSAAATFFVPFTFSRSTAQPHQQSLALVFAGRTLASLFAASAAMSAEVKKNITVRQRQQRQQRGAFKAATHAARQPYNARAIMRMQRAGSADLLACSN